MNKELIEILKCISEFNYYEKIPIYKAVYSLPGRCDFIQCNNCVVTTGSNLSYKPYLIKL